MRRGAGVLALAALMVVPLPGLWLVPEQGLPLLRPAWPGSRFALEFVHSRLGVPVREEYRVAGLALRLERVWVPAAQADALADYYGMVPAPSPSGAAEVALRPTRPALHRALSLLATPGARRALVHGRCRLALAPAGRPALRWRLQLRMLPLAGWLAAAGRGLVRCPER